MKTITLLGDYITLEILTRWIRAAYVVVSEVDAPARDNEIKRVLKVVSV